MFYGMGKRCPHDILSVFYREIYYEYIYYIVHIEKRTIALHLFIMVENVLNEP